MRAYSASQPEQPEHLDAYRHRADIFDLPYRQSCAGSTTTYAYSLLLGLPFCCHAGAALSQVASSGLLSYLLHALSVHTQPLTRTCMSLPSILRSSPTSPSMYGSHLRTVYGKHGNR